MSLTARLPMGRTAESDAVEGLARWGLAARATNYVLVGVLAVLLAFGHQTGETDQHGALQQVTHHTGGTVLVWVIALGLFAYALWRFHEAAFGVAGKGRKAGPRLVSLFRGVVYAVLGASAVQVALHSSKGNQSGRQQLWTARVMAHPGGRWAVGAVGVGLVIFGAVQVFRGVRRDFEKRFELGRMSPGARRTTEVLGTIGCPARGIAFALVGVFLVVAAVQYDAKKAAGLDGALRQLRDATAGPLLLGLVSLGLIVFGLYGYCEAMWRRT